MFNMINIIYYIYNHKIKNYIIVKHVNIMIY